MRCFLPGAGVYVVAVKVVHQAVLVGRKSFVATVNVHAATGGVISAAVTVAPLRNSAFGLWNQPDVGLWYKNRNEFSTDDRNVSLDMYTNLKWS